MGGVSAGGPVKKVTVRCEREEGCPLYQRGDRIEFANVAVTGLEHAPVCFRAVIKFAPIIDRIRAGSPPWNFDGAPCGGCEHGQAWFKFSSAAPETPTRPNSRFEEFAIGALSTMKLFTGVHPAILRRIVPFLRERSVRSGDVLVRAGDRTGALMLIAGGRFDVLAKDEKKVEKHLMTLSRGDCVGETTLVTGEPAYATVVSCGAGQLLEIPSREFPVLLSLVPTLGLSLARDVLQRFSRMGAAARDAGHDGIIGRLEVVGPAELVQAMHLNRQTGVLVVQHEQESGTMYFQEGVLYDVRLGHETGDEAFFKFAGWTRGLFRFEPGRRDTQRAIGADTMALLLEAMRRLDEARAAPPSKV